MSWVIKALGKKWKDFKCELKKKHYDAHKTFEERLADRDPRVIPDQWKHLVDFWNSEEGQVSRKVVTIQIFNIILFCTWLKIFLTIITINIGSLFKEQG